MTLWEKAASACEAAREEARGLEERLQRGAIYELAGSYDMRTHQILEKMIELCRDANEDVTSPEAHAARSFAQVIWSRTSGREGLLLKACMAVWEAAYQHYPKFGGQTDPRPR